LIAATTAAWKTYTDAFELGLSAYGWAKDTDYKIDYEPTGGAAGDLLSMQKWADQFVKNGVDKAMGEALEILKLLGVAAYPGDIPDQGSIQKIIDDLYTTYNVDTLFVCSDPLLSAYADNLDNATANSAQGVARGKKIKAMYEFREYVDRHPHATQCYGPNFVRLFSQAAWYVYQILNNHVSPANLSVYMPGPPYDQVP
jgi:hypothetical protein